MSTQGTRYTGNQRVFGPEAQEVAFPLGGIGTGTVSLGARGELRDWEIFNRPGYGNTLPHALFLIRTQDEKGNVDARVLQAREVPPYNGPQGLDFDVAGGLPRFAHSAMAGEYPFAFVELWDKTMPIRVLLEAFNPLIPLNADDSGLPCAVMTYKVENTSQSALDISLGLSMSNVMGQRHQNQFGRLFVDETHQNDNTVRQYSELTGIHYTTTKFPKGHIFENDVSLCYLGQDEVTASPYYPGVNWRVQIDRYWQDFVQDGKLIHDERHPGSTLKLGALAVNGNLAPGEIREFRFLICWNTPNRMKSWNEDLFPPETAPTIRNYYATWLHDSWATAQYVQGQLPRLEEKTRSFHRALFSTSMPAEALDAIASNISALRSNTCFRIEDGTFLGWEGVGYWKGSCEGTCTHVWNYAQTVAYLFPELERSARRVEFNTEVEPDGYMHFRARTVLGLPKAPFHPAADGQNGTIIRAYREWKLSGDQSFLAEIWNGMKRAFEFNFKRWDLDGDYVLEAQQHNTYDIEFYGPNPLTQMLFLGAMRAMAKMAKAMGDEELAARCAENYANAAQRTEERLWNGEYYVQRLEGLGAYDYQFGNGCLADQLFGQFMAYCAGLGRLTDEEKTKQALDAVFTHNFKQSMDEYPCLHRCFAINEEPGLVLCAWPHQDAPEAPFYFSDEVWTGIEYHVAATLIWEGRVGEGLRLVEAVRSRYDGVKRNPWSELECGYHYARSMASWGLLLAHSGFQCDGIAQTLTFSPVAHKEPYTTFWSCGAGWGTITIQPDGQYEIEVLGGDMQGYAIVHKPRGEA